MALTQSNIVWYGSFTAVFKTAGVSTKTISNLNEEAVTFGLETKTSSKVFADGTEKTFITGRKLTVELTFDELVVADLDTLESTDNLAITFDNGKVVTVAVAGTSETYSVVCSVDGGKSKITVVMTGASNSTIADIFSVA